MTTYTAAQVNAWYQAIDNQASTASLDASDLAVYVASLNSGALTPAQVQNSIETTTFTTGTVDAVIREYQAAFGRVPDQAGLEYWVGQVAANPSALGTLNTIFANSAEFNARYGATATTVATPAVIADLYTNVLGRAPDAAGLAYWSAQGLTAAQLLQAFSQSAEFVNDASAPIMAYQAAEVAGTAPTTGSLFANTPIVNQSINLTTGIDAPGVGAFASLPHGVASNTVVYGSLDGNGGTTTFGNGDQIVAQSGASNVTLTLSDNGLNNANFYSALDLNAINTTVSGVTTLNVTANEAVHLNAVSGVAPAIDGVTGPNGVNSGYAPLSSDTQGYNGLTAINITSQQSGNGYDVVNAAATTAVTINDTTYGTLTGPNPGYSFDMYVIGGSTVNITENNGANNNSSSGIEVLGGTGTTSVSITQTKIAGVGYDQGIAVQDVNFGSATANGTITTVTLNGIDGQAGPTPMPVYAGYGYLIADSALATLNLTNVSNMAGGTDSLWVESSLTTEIQTSLQVNLNNVSNSLLGLWNSQENGTGYTTVNLTLANSASLAIWDDTSNGVTNVGSVTTLNVNGTGVLTATESTLNAIKTITVSGAAGLVDPTDFATSTTLTSVTDTASGVVTLGLNDTVASFSGAKGAGTEIITIAADATQTITGNGLATSEVVFNNAAATFTTANTGANVTGFSVLGVGSSLASTGGTFDLGTTFKGYTAIDDQGANGAVTFSNVAAGTALSIDATNNGNVTYQLATAGTATTAANVTLGLSAAEAAILGLDATATTFSVVSVGSQLTLWDSSFVGLANVNFTVNTADGTADILGILNDQSLSALSVSGTGDLIIAQYTDTLASLSVTDNSKGAGLSFVGGILDNALTSLTVAGTNTATLTLGDLVDSAKTLTLTDSYAGNVSLILDATNAFTTESFTNSSAKGVLTVNDGSNGVALASLTLNGAVATVVTDDLVTKGITVSGASDNQVVVVVTDALGGAQVTSTAGVYYSDSITLGNGNDIVTDNGVGNISVTLGNGNDTVTLGVGAAATTQTVVVGNGTNTIASYSVGAVTIHAGTGANTVTTAADATVTEVFGAHALTVADTITVGASDASATAIVSIKGLNSAATGLDSITFAADAGNVTAGAVINENTNISTYLLANNLTSTLAHDITAVLSAGGGNLAQHSVGEFTFGGNTYVIEHGSAGNVLAVGDTLVELVGTTVTALSSVTAAGVLTLHG